MTDPGGWTSPDQPPQQPPPMPPPAPRPPYGPGAGLGKPGVIPLRPLNVGEILDGAITTMRRYPALVFGMSAVVAVLAGVLDFLLTYYVVGDLPDPQRLSTAATQQEQLNYLADMFSKLSGSLGVSVLITLLTHTFLSGFITVVVGRAVLGRPVKLGEAVAELRPRLLPLLGLTLLTTICILVGTFLLIIPGIFLYTMLSLTAPALVLERGTIGQAFKRSWRLVSGSWWRVFGILLLAGLVGFLISMVIQLPFGLGGGLSADPTQPVTLTLGSRLLTELGSVIAQTIVVPFTSAATALLYIDQRMRREGMDIQLARSAGLQQ